MSDEKVVIVSCDTHIGPRAKEDLREYCPEKYLDQYDDFLAYLDANPPLAVPGPDATTGHFDMHQRIRDLDQDGTAGEVIFHGSQNGQPIPFNVADYSTGSITAVRKYDVDHELAGLGRHIYNAWLADVCSIEPERHVGLAQLPMWDVDEAVKEMQWAREHGLRGINFPADSGAEYSIRSRYLGKEPYNHPDWEPFWAAAEDLGMALCTHGGAGQPNIDLPAGHSIWLYEAQEQSRRPIHQLILSGVFERHPGLRLVLTENPGLWWTVKMADLDSMMKPTSGGMVGISKRPSELAKQSVFVGASFQARFEVADAVENDYWTNCIWGTDYPHIEGTWKYIDDLDAEPYSQRSLRYTYHDVDDDIVRAILGGNAVGCYGLDGEALHKVAQRINAPTMAQIHAEPPEIPADHGMWAFRQAATFG